MVLALGFWALALGYTLVYTGVEWFVAGKGSLAENIGLPTAASLVQQQNATGAQTAGTTTNPAASGLYQWSQASPQQQPSATGRTASVPTGSGPQYT